MWVCVGVRLCGAATDWWPAHSVPCLCPTVTRLGSGRPVTPKEIKGWMNMKVHLWGWICELIMETFLSVIFNFFGRTPPPHPLELLPFLWSIMQILIKKTFFIYLSLGLHANFFRRMRKKHYQHILHTPKKIHDNGNVGSQESRHKRNQLKNTINMFSCSSSE